MMQNYRIFLAILLFIAPTFMLADVNPTINLKAVYTDSEGEQQTVEFPDESASISGNAPLDVAFSVNPQNTDGWTCHYEWRFYEQSGGTLSSEPYIIRYDENTDVTFTKAGTTYVECYVTFTKGSSTVEFTEEYWADCNPLPITISESKLEMPNAFSPNGDEINDFYRPKTCQSIVSFKATIFNRWGQKLYEWTDPNDKGWDGTFHGRNVAQGTYFCNVIAEGADGTKYHIRRDVNLLRGFTEDSTTTEE